MSFRQRQGKILVAVFICIVDAGERNPLAELAGTGHRETK